MELGWLQDVLDPRQGAEGTAGGAGAPSEPVVAVYLDATRDDASGKHEEELRWKALRSHLRDEEGAPEQLLAEIDAVLNQRTRAAGPHGRAVIAGADGVRLDVALPDPPVRDLAHYSTVPPLMPLVRGLDAILPYVFVQVDRAGADITVFAPYPVSTEPREALSAMQQPGQTHQVAGGHDVLHKVPGGGWSHRRYQQRVQDSWERNAEAVAADLERTVIDADPAAVILAGDVRATALLRQFAGHRTSAVLHEVEGGGRPEGTSPESLDDEVRQILDDVRAQRRAEALDKLGEQTSLPVPAIGLARVVEALRASQVETLIIVDDPTSTMTLWAGEHPLLLGLDRAEVEALGAREPAEYRGDAVLLRAAIAQGAAAEVVPIEQRDTLPAEPELPDGLAAVLRFSTAPTPPGG